MKYGILENELKSWFLPFIIYNKFNRPALIAKWAQSLNGLLANDSMESKWISGDLSKYYTHFLREKYDAIIVGKNTLLFDTPELTARHNGVYSSHQPIRIIYDPNLDVLNCADNIWLNLNQKFFNDVSKILIISKKSAVDKSNSDRYYFVSKMNNIKILSLNEDEIRLENLIENVSSKNCTDFFGKPVQSVLVEGGPSFLSSLFNLDMIDSSHIYISSNFLSGHKNKININNNELFNLSEISKNIKYHNFSLNSEICIEKNYRELD